MKSEVESITLARGLDRVGRPIRFVPFVKTKPTPSNKYEETVCVAGVALDPMRWVRLYPIRFRQLEDASKFHKYEPIEVEVAAPSTDRRPESLRVTSEPKVVARPIRGWDQRYPLIADLPNPSLCQLQRGIAKDMNGQSLAAIEVRAKPQVLVSPNGGWNPKQQATINKWANPDLFGNIAMPLEPTRFTVKLKFSCIDDSCNGHTITLIDWEASELERRFKDQSLEYAQEQFTIKFIEQKFKPGKTTRLLVGNQEMVAKRKSFLALGVFGPYFDPKERLF